MMHQSLDAWLQKRLPIQPIHSPKVDPPQVQLARTEQEVAKVAKQVALSLVLYRVHALQSQTITELTDIVGCSQLVIVILSKPQYRQVSVTQTLDKYGRSLTCRARQRCHQ